MAVFIGTPGDDTLRGSSSEDLIWLLAGDDRGGGRAGNDTIFGDTGNDTLRGGDDDDRLNSSAGNDLAIGNFGDDTLRGGDGNDTLSGGAGNDRFFGNFGNDVIIDDAGTTDSPLTTSEVFAGDGKDKITVDMEVGSEQFENLAINVIINGDDDDDDITSNPRLDNNIDTNYAYDYSATVTQVIDAGAGNDVIFTEPFARVGFDRYERFESSTSTIVFGDDGNDNITVNPKNDYHTYVRIEGGDGDDTIRHEIVSASIESIIDGGQGNDTAIITGETGASFITELEFLGGDGDDTCDVDLTGRPFEFGSTYDVSLFGDDGEDQLTADCAVDAYNGYGANVFISADGGLCSDVIDISASAVGDPFFEEDQIEARNTLFGGDGDDEIAALARAKNIDPGYEIIPVAINDIDGGIGNDTIVGEIAADSDTGSSSLQGGAGYDELTAIGGEDNVLDGGADDDVLTGSENADIFVLREGDGTDTVTNFQDGVDLFGLADGLAFDQLSITNGGSGAEISQDAELLAIVLGIDASNLTDVDFTPL